MLNEAKDDNLHQFIRYMNECGGKGELGRSPVTAERKFSEVKFNINDHIGEFDNELAGIIYEYMCDREDVYDDDGNEIDIEYILELENMLSCIRDIDGFNEYLIETAHNQIFCDLEEDDRNMIYIEREILVPDFVTKGNVYSLFKNTYNGKLGVYWTYARDNAEAQWGFDEPDTQTVTLFGHVSPDDVDWNKTVSANLRFPEEKELNLKDGAVIELDEVKTSTGHTVFRGKLLYKA